MIKIQQCFLIGLLSFVIQPLCAGHSKLGPTEQVVCGVLAAGSALSAVVWTPQVLKTIQQRGVIGAIVSTHIPRLVLDGAVATFCGYLLLKKK